MNTDELQLLRDFRSGVRDLDIAVFETLQPRGLVVRRRRRVKVAVAVAAAFVVLTGGAAALAVHFFGPSPAFTSGFSAFDRLPEAEWPSSMPRVGLEHQAAYLGLSTGEAEHRLRLLRTGLTLGPGRSVGRGELYVLLGTDGSGCIELTGEGAGCVLATNTRAMPGVLPAVFPGYPGQTPAFAAIVADDVNVIELDVSGKRKSLPIINNSVYADLDFVRACDTLAVVATYGDDSTRTLPIHNSVADSLAITGAGQAHETGPNCSN
jgi:hypothetical protein